VYNSILAIYYSSSIMGIMNIFESIIIFVKYV